MLHKRLQEVSVVESDTNGGHCEGEMSGTATNMIPVGGI